MDSSDESSDCLPQDCHSSEFRCRKSNLCIPMSFVCDGERDCGADDRTDERNCNTSKSNFTLSSSLINFTQWVEHHLELMVDCLFPIQIFPSILYSSICMHLSTYFCLFWYGHIQVNMTLGCQGDNRQVVFFYRGQIIHILKIFWHFARFALHQLICILND